MEKELTCHIINRYSAAKGIEEFEDILITEKRFAVYVNGEYHKTILCTPSNIDDLLIAQLVLEGLICDYGDIREMDIQDENIYVAVDLKDGPEMRGGHEGDYQRGVYLAEDVIRLMREHLQSSRLHRLTGGVHIMSIASKDQLLLTREDVGRHNAIDKIYGFCLKNNWDCSDKIFLSSGRITHEIVQKIKRLGVGIAASRAAVTSLAKETAEKAGLTLIGFARGDRFNIYSHPQRIQVKGSR
ncbi:MAG: formate dehydrogenase accessory sulfurtransferase FdhD [Syntrophomonadaceae bacterium]|nr:formate dehydrogenase accessory sulfurtransferase FdhD [Syntrophomonadaceae bacterium]